MKDNMKKALFVLRVLLGWLFLYYGYTKIQSPEWTAQGYLDAAMSLKPFYNWLSSESNILWVNFLVKWGELLIGAGLILGAFTTLASYGAILMMVVYYFLYLDFPYTGGGYNLLVDMHLIYVAAFAVLITTRAGQFWGLDKTLAKKFKFKGYWF